MRVASPDGLPVERFADAGELDAWLDCHHGDSGGFWIQMAKAGTGVRSISWATAVPIALCHGWIDGQSKRVDDDWFLQKVTPRQARSLWSRVNVALVVGVSASSSAIRSTRFCAAVLASSPCRQTYFQRMLAYSTKKRSGTWNAGGAGSERWSKTA